LRPCFVTYCTFQDGSYACYSVVRSCQPDHRSELRPPSNTLVPTRFCSQFPTEALKIDRQTGVRVSCAASVSAFLTILTSTVLEARGSRRSRALALPVHSPVTLRSRRRPSGPPRVRRLCPLYLEVSTLSPPSVQRGATRQGCCDRTLRETSRTTLGELESGEGVVERKSEHVSQVGQSHSKRKPPPRTLRRFALPHLPRRRPGTACSSRAPMHPAFHDSLSITSLQCAMIERASAVQQIECTHVEYMSNGREICCNKLSLDLELSRSSTCRKLCGNNAEASRHSLALAQGK